MTPSVRLTILYQAINDEKKTNEEEHARGRWRCDALEEGSLGPFEGPEAGTPANSWAAHTTILASLFWLLWIVSCLGIYNRRTCKKRLPVS